MGNMVNIWNDALLIDDNNRFIETQVVKGLESMHVYHLMVDNGSRWDAQMIDSPFQNRDAIAIQGIPLSSRGVGDKLIWHFSKDGRFNVKLDTAWQWKFVDQIWLKLFKEHEEEFGVFVYLQRLNICRDGLSKLSPYKIRLQQKGVEVHDLFFLLQCDW
ncbi:hypothetical protein NC651_007531 [Populus alba x Populus x berolinensis]|nr:hypothetical protein NC651_007531 [Populus alba x Populus x berolinensis]